MQALIADAFPAAYLPELRELGLSVEYKPDLTADALVEAAAPAHILVVRSKRVTRPVIERASSLALIVRAGAGYDTIDVDAASERGIYVSNCPGKNSAAVAELTMGLLLALDRRIVANTRDLSAGKWNKKEYSKAEGLKGKTIGVVGTGPIGACVAARAAAFEMKVVAWSRSLTESSASNGAPRSTSSPRARTSSPSTSRRPTTRSACSAPTSSRR